MPIYPNFYQTLTPCPVVELRGYAAANGLKGRLFAYLDFNGPTGTARDGLAEGMLALAIEQKKLAPGQPIIEAVSGPFATALTLAGLTAGHPVVLVMPEDAPALRQENLLRLGAQIQHSPARSGLAGARALAARGSCGICTSSSACTALAKSRLSVTSTGLASLSCSAWLSRSAATHAGLQVPSASTRISDGPAIISMPTLPNTFRFAVAT